MVRLLSIGIECFSTLVFLIPAMLVLQCAFWKPQGAGKVVLAILFSVYSMAVFSVTGLPTVRTVRIDFAMNWIPLLDIIHDPAGYIRTSVLNIILFLPMGFLLPVIWEEYRSVTKTACMGLAVSVSVEFLQIFTFRLTDVDDLIMNTLGTILGYFIARLISFRLPWELSGNDKNRAVKYEAVMILCIVFLIGFFLKPLVSDALWNWVLSGSLWEQIK